MSVMQDDGRLWKLVSMKGTLLGHIQIPPEWEEVLEDRSYERISYYKNPGPVRPIGGREWMPIMDNIAVFYVARSHNLDYPGALELHGISIEEFEQIPGCAFVPSAGYLRSLIE